MQKNKEDNFLGDNLTGNIKYYDNEWQAQGTVDRNSSFTKESILHLALEGVNYKSVKKDYEGFVPRASTINVTSLADKSGNRAVVPASATHDILLLDANYYLSTSKSTTINISDLNTFAKKAFGISNPVYDAKAAYKTIELVDFTNSSFLRLSVKEFFKKTLPAYYISGFEESSPQTFSAELEYEFSTMAPQVLNSTSASNTLSYLLLQRYGLSDWTKKGSSSDYTFEDWVKDTNTAARKGLELFKRDFVLRLHDPDSVKLPFVQRNLPEEDNNEDKNIYTRFIANEVTSFIVDATNIDYNYTEFINDIFEENVLKSKVAGTYKDNSYTEFTHALQSGIRFTDYEGNVFDPTSTLQKVISTRSNDNISNNCEKVYTSTDEDSVDTAFIHDSYGIFLFGEEQTSNLFQDENSNYQLFNHLIIGYRTIDALIAARTFLGGLYYLQSPEVGSQASISNSFDIKTTNIRFPAELLDTISTHENGTRSSSQLTSALIENQNIYYTISTLENLYRVGHGIEEIPREANNYIYSLSDPIKEWLEKETFIFKAPVYGDYVEELNFLQDLTPDSAPQFSGLRIKKTEVTYKRNQDSKVEIPFVEKTAPMLNNTPQNPEGMGVYGSDAFSALGLKDSDSSYQFGKTIPPFLYDYDKGDESDAVVSADARVKSSTGNGQRINSKTGGMVIEDRIISPTIDELWTFLKYLTESDGSARSELEIRLPSFYGLDVNYIRSNDGKIPYLDAEGAVIQNRVNPKASKTDTRVIDILDWEPSVDENSFNPFYEDSNATTSNNSKELTFGGYEVTKSIEKIYDYKVNAFSRYTNVNKNTGKANKDGDVYEYNTEADTFEEPKGYLDTLYNEAILNFINADTITFNPNKGKFDSGTLFTASNDTALGFVGNDDSTVTDYNIKESSTSRRAAYELLRSVLNYHSTESNHNHYKEYLEHPKNLKTIERDLEAIRQNLQTLSEYTSVVRADKGFADRGANRGTLHSLHRNSFEFDSTLISLTDVNNTKANTNNTEYDYEVEVGNIFDVNAFTDSLNNVVDTLDVKELDQKVVFDDGSYADRYKYSNYDRKVVDLSGAVKNTRAKHAMYRPNETLLSEVYLAADGTWRSVHEHLVAPILECDE